MCVSEEGGFTSDFLSNHSRIAYERFLGKSGETMPKRTRMRCRAFYRHYRERWNYRQKNAPLIGKWQKASNGLSFDTKH